VVSGSPSEVARLVLDLALARPATLGSGRLICVDGPAGSGKSTLAEAIAALEPSARVVHMDDLYDGWPGLPNAAAQFPTLLDPLSRNEPGSYRRYDWHARAFAESVTVDPVSLLVLEGVSSAAPAYAHLVTVVVWVEAPSDLRLTRGLARDGQGSRAEWQQWMAEETEVLAGQRTRDRADVLVDGTGTRPPEIRSQAP